MLHSMICSISPDISIRFLEIFFSVRFESLGHWSASDNPYPNSGHTLDFVIGGVYLTLRTKTKVTMEAPCLVEHRVPLQRHLSASGGSLISHILLSILRAPFLSIVSTLCR